MSDVRGCGSPLAVAPLALALLLVAGLVTAAAPVSARALAWHAVRQGASRSFSSSGLRPRRRAGPNADAVGQLPPVSYTAIDGDTETLTPWQGEYVSVLVEPGPTRDPAVMSRLVIALDRAWRYYADTTGRLPAMVHSLNGRDEIAEVTTTCGAGCTYFGATGTEILTQYFESMYQEVAQHDLYDQIPFYELGRSFWFWSPQLQFKAPDQDPVVTGFAVWMRFESMAAAGLDGAPFNGTPFPTFASRVAALAGQYEADPSLTFAQTLAQDKSPGAYGGTDFWASLMMQLAQRHGGQTFITRFLQKVGTLPTATSTAGAVTDWEQAASYAACTDLSPVFYTRWGFPRPDGTVTPRPPASTVPEPTAGACADVTPTRPVRCVVPNVKGWTLSAAKSAITKSRCRTGTIRRSSSATVKKGLVISQHPSAGAKHRRGYPVDLIISSGPRRR